MASITTALRTTLSEPIPLPAPRQGREFLLFINGRDFVHKIFRKAAFRLAFFAVLSHLLPFVSSNAQNGNGVFSYGTGTTVNISNSTIRTSADNSGGLQTTGGGTTNASDLTIETSGNSSAAIRSDRGGGTVNADGGSSASHGWGTAVEDNAVVTIEKGST